MPQLTYGTIPEGDRERMAQISAHAFHTTVDAARASLAGDRPGTHRGLYADGRLVTSLLLYSLQVMAGRGNVTCGGIGGVATPPEERRRGYTAAALRHACDELMSQGTALCMLGPFKESFYGRYGWAICMERKVYTGAPHLFASFRQGAGRFERVGEEAIPELGAIYAGALRGRFGPLVRDAQAWGYSIFYRDAAHAYLWRDDAGAARAYLAYQFRDGPAGKVMRCSEAVALDPQARAQLFAFMHNHDSQCDEITFRAPADAPVNLLFPDPLRCEVQPTYMLRLLDVAGALSAFPFPPDLAGRLTLAVADDWLAHNQGVFELEVAGGAASVRRLADGAPADLACDVRALAQIYTRLLRPRTAAAFGLLGVRERAALRLLDALFAGLAPFCLDSF